MDTALSLPTASPFALGAPGLTEAGLHPLCIGPGVKKPQNYDPRSGTYYDAVGWTHFATKPPTPGLLDRWSSAPNANVGIAMGSPAGDGLFLVAIDIDLEAEDDIAALRAALPSSPVRKVGAKGETLLFRAPPEITTTAYNIGSGRAVDLLAKGRQTVMPPSQHPTGVAYRYVDGSGLVPVETLPVFGVAEKEALETALRGLGWEEPGDHTSGDVPAAGEASHGRGGAGDAARDYWRQINDAALSNFSAWVPALGLPNLAAKGSGGYVATAFWRPSNTGKALADRGPNLSFHRTGITDHGDIGSGGKAGKGYTAIDIVVAATGKIANDAATWLDELLGVSAEENAAIDHQFDHGSIVASSAARANQVEALKEDEAVATITTKLASAITWDDRVANRSRTLPWLVKGLLPANGVSLLWGQSGAGKSFVALELAACVVSGQPFFGHRLKAPGGMLFALGEGGGTMPDRMEALKRARFNDVAPVDPTTGRPMDLDRLPVAWVPVSNLDKPAPWRAFADHVREVAADVRARHGCPLRLVIIDTIVASFGFAEDPDAAAATRAMRAMDDLAQELGILFLPIHHAGKSKAAGEHGSYAWRGSAETSIEVEAERDQATGAVTGRRIFLRKNRHGGNEGWNRPFELREVELGRDEDDDAITSAIVVPAADAEGANDNEAPREAPGRKRIDKFMKAFDLVYQHTKRTYTVDGVEHSACKIADVQMEYLNQNGGNGAKRDNVTRYFRDAKKEALAQREVFETDGLMWPYFDLPLPEMLADDQTLH